MSEDFTTGYTIDIQQLGLFVILFSIYDNCEDTKIDNQTLYFMKYRTLFLLMSLFKIFCKVPLHIFSFREFGDH